MNANDSNRRVVLPLQRTTHPDVEESKSVSSYDEFLLHHQNQLTNTLQIPHVLLPDIHQQLIQTFIYKIDNSNNNNEMIVWDIEHATKNSIPLQLKKLQSKSDSNDDDDDDDDYQSQVGAMIIVPHIITWDITHGHSLIGALQNTSISILQIIYNGLQQIVHQEYCNVVDTTGKDCIDPKKFDLMNAIIEHPIFWSRVILYRSSNDNGTIRAAIPPPPYLPHVPICIGGSSNNSNNNTSSDTPHDADCTGPIPFQYYHPAIENQIIDVSLLYVSPEGMNKMKHINNYIPTIDVVPSYQYPNNDHIRQVRYAALLYKNKNELPDTIYTYVKGIYANFVHDMHLVRQRLIEHQHNQTSNTNTPFETKDIDIHDDNQNKIYNVYTDSNDPLELKHPIVGLEANSTHFKIVDAIEHADIIYSYQSLFSPTHPYYQFQQRQQEEEVCNHHKKFINQFPYEGALVQKDHLAREIFQQYGLPRPIWAIETYDLDVQLPQFVGSVLLTASSSSNEGNDHSENSNSQNTSPTWIVKPAFGTQSQGHVVTSDLGYILRLNDAVGGHRIVQRYIDNPVCMNGHKVDCRIIVLMTSAGQRIDDTNTNQQQVQLPTLFMHNVCYFRIANKPHNIVTAIDRMDHESVLTASHLLRTDYRTSTNELRKLPFYTETIQQLEREYPNVFDWDNIILPQIKTMICELFNGVTNAYPQMTASKESRAMYGVDVMFQIDDDHTDHGHNICIVPKLLEVTFCPANNAICDAYERYDDELYRSYNKEIFECLFLNIISNNITQLQ